MGERDSRPPLADDPDFLASLASLDAGLHDGARTPEHSEGAKVDRPRFGSRPPTKRIPLPPSIVSPFEALTAEQPEPEPSAPHEPTPFAPPPVPPSPESSSEPRRRAFVDLFPPEEARTAKVAAKPARMDRPRLRRERRAAPRDAVSAPPFQTFYGLRENPFALTADPRFFYHSGTHDGVSQQLLTAIRKHEGLIVLTGDIGTGKTTLCRTIIEQLDRRTLTSFVTEPFVSGEELLKTILADFGVMSREELASGAHATRHDLSTTLISFVESLAPLEATALVMIDEAQNLPPDVVEQVRILAEAAEASHRLQIVLVGQPALATLLRRSECRPLQQRVTLRCALEPLSPNEIDGYVMHRLAVAGTGIRIEFNQPAIERLYRLSLGVPRVVNLLCERALVRGSEASASVIDAALMEAAAEDLDLAEPPSRAHTLARRVLAVAILASCVAAGGALAAWAFHDALLRVLAQWRR